MHLANVAFSCIVKLIETHYDWLRNLALKKIPDTLIYAVFLNYSHRSLISGTYNFRVVCQSILVV